LRSAKTLSGVGEVPAMKRTESREDHELNEKPAIILEFIAATTVLSVVAVVLFMIFNYRPV
jgi:hypothetical protein